MNIYKILNAAVMSPLMGEVMSSLMGGGYESPNGGRLWEALHSSIINKWFSPFW